MNYEITNSASELGSIGKVEASHTCHLEFSPISQLTHAELAIEKKLRRKIDLLIMPLMILTYLMNYIDRNNYAAARLQGLERDLGLNQEEYQIGLSVLFIAYVLMQVPSNLLLNYFGRPSWYLGFFICAWGLISALTSQVTSFGGIVACRFLLGLAEAPFLAGVLFYLSKWYTRAELSFRMAIFFSASMISGAFGNLIAAGILGGLDGARGMASWQWLYIIEGGITVAVGIVCVLVLPDFPDTWKALSPEMKFVANRRLTLDGATADVDGEGAMKQIDGLKAAFADPKTYIIALSYHGITAAAGFQNFLPTLTATLGYSNIISLILIAPPYLFIVVWSLGHSLASDRLQNRFWFFVYPIPVSIVGFVIFMATDTFGPRYFSLFLMLFVFAQNAILYAWVVSAIPRPPAKRAVVLAFMNCVGNLASVWTPFTYRTQDAPHYRLSLGICIGLELTALLCAITLRWYLMNQNAELERLESAGYEPSGKELKRLEKMAEIQGIDIAEARKLQRGYRYTL